MSSQQAPIFDTGWQGFPLTGSCQIPRRSAERRGADQGQEGTLISVRPGQAASRNTPGRAHLGRLADNAAMTMDSSAGALAPGETVAGVTGRRCA